MIEFEHVSKTYETHNDENVALDDINIKSRTASSSLSLAIPVRANPPSSN